jgi:Ni,Fe-hydrogenase I large subunit
VAAASRVNTGVTPVQTFAMAIEYNLCIACAVHVHRIRRI